MAVLVFGLIWIVVYEFPKSSVFSKYSDQLLTCICMTACSALLLLLAVWIITVYMCSLYSGRSVYITAPPQLVDRFWHIQTYHLFLFSQQKVIKLMECHHIKLSSTSVSATLPLTHHLAVRPTLVSVFCELPLVDVTVLRSEDGVSGVSSAYGTSSVGSLGCFFEGKARASSGFCSFGQTQQGKKQISWREY